MAGEARHGAAVRAAGRVAAGVAGFRAALAAAPVGAGVPAGDAGVHRPERGCGEGGEHGRVLRDGLGDAFAADQQRPDDLVRVALVHLGAVRADGGAAVAARLVDDVVGHVLCGRVRQDAPGAGVVVHLDPVHVPVQADRLGTAGGRFDVAQPGVEVRPGDAGLDLVVDRGAQVGAGRLGARGRTRSGSFGYDGQRRDGHRLAFTGWPLTVVVVGGRLGGRVSRASACWAWSVVTLSRTAT